MYILQTMHTFCVQLDEFLPMCVSCNYCSDSRKKSLKPQMRRFYLDSQNFGYQVPWLVCGITRIGIITAVPRIKKSLYLNKNTNSYHLIVDKNNTAWLRFISHQHVLALYRHYLNLTAPGGFVTVLFYRC